MLGIDADWKALTLCLIGASTFWFFNAMNDDHTSNLGYPVVFQYDETEVMPVGELPETLPLNATGYGWDLLRLSLGINRRPLIIEMDLFRNKSFITSRNLLPVVKEQLNDIRVNYLLEDTVYLPFDEIGQKTFILKADENSVMVQPGFEVVGNIDITPDTITLRGPESHLREMGDTILVDIPSDAVSDDFSDSIDLGLNLGPMIQAEEDKARVSFDVEPFIHESRQVDINPLGFPEESTWSLSQDYVVITFKLHPDDLNRLREKELRVVLPFSDLNSGDSTIAPVLTNAPDFVEEVRITPQQIQVSHAE